jgi:hypothetical protein
LLEISKELTYKPENFEVRLAEIILHRRENRDLHHCLRNIKQLFIETIEVFRSVYPSEKIDTVWPKS